MPISIIVGGQFGSEGKGKVAHYLAKTEKATFAVRCGGPNSGHTVNGKILRHLPTPVLLPEVKLALGAGSYIDKSVLLSEIKEFKISKERLFIDSGAVIISPEMKEREKALIDSIGSVGTGTGAALISRISRDGEVQFACQDPDLAHFTTDVSEMLNESLIDYDRIIIEGSQGFGLSLLHSQAYPKVTSRDTTAAGFLSEVGLSPFDVDDIVLVIRTFPIRVAGNSGPLPNETTWEEVTRIGYHKTPIEEFSSVSKKLRRVAEFDPEVVKRAIRVNGPTRVFLNHVDYVQSSINENTARSYVKRIENLIGKEIYAFGLGPNNVTLV